MSWSFKALLLSETASTHAAQKTTKHTESSRNLSVIYKSRLLPQKLAVIIKRSLRSLHPDSRARSKLAAVYCLVQFLLDGNTLLSNVILGERLLLPCSLSLWCCCCSCCCSSCRRVVPLGVVSCSLGRWFCRSRRLLGAAVCLGITRLAGGCTAVGVAAELPRLLQRFCLLRGQETAARPSYPPRRMVVPRLVQIWLHTTSINHIIAPCPAT